MIGFDSITTISGVVAGLATFLYFSSRRALAYLLFLIMGSGGLAILWDRWSERAGHRAQFGALLSPVSPTTSEVWLLCTHLPLFILGLIGVITKLRETHRVE